MTLPNPPRKWRSALWLAAILVIACCCLTVLALALGAMLFNGDWLGFSQETDQPDKIAESGPQLTQAPLPTNTEPLASPTPLPTATPTQRASMAGADQTWQALLDELVPINDLSSLAERLSDQIEIPLTDPDPNAPYALGATQDFWVSNVDTDRNFEISATLRYLGEHVYIWIEDGVYYEPADLTALGDAFDNEIYSTNRDFFGSEWNPGVDGDPRIYIVYARGLGDSLAGYFSSVDELHPNAYDFSNAHEMFLINADNVDLWEEYVYGTLAHEFQHMIHWYTDKNEETWLNEGFSMLAELINGYDSSDFNSDYIARPDLQLTDWELDIGDNDAHYGASMLFTIYFFDRFGESATQAVVAHPQNGMDSIDIVLTELGITDPLTGKQITADDVFADWAVANLIGDSSVANGRYGYKVYPSALIVKPDTVISTCPTDGPMDYEVHQFGVDYIKLNCPGEHTLHFTGSSTVTFIPIAPYSGDYFFWSNIGDESNMSLERSFDLTDVTGPVEMTYQTWYDLEENYDYVYISATTDGEHWQLLESTSCNIEDPFGVSYGCGLNGQTHSWHKEFVDLSAYAGQEVTVRFDYVTDSGINGAGMVIDDVQVAAIGYFSDFETDEGGWQGEGFVRIQNNLPQYYRVSLVTFGDAITVTPLELNAENQASIPFNLTSEGDYAVLIISGTTSYTRQSAAYQIEIQ